MGESCDLMPRNGWRWRVTAGVHGHFQVVKLLGQADHLGQLVVFHAEQHALAHVVTVAGGGKALEQRFVEGPAQTQYLAGGFISKAQNGVGIGDLSKEKTGTLTGVIGDFYEGPEGYPKCFQRGAHHNLGGQVHHGNPGDLAQVGDRPGSPGIDLNDKELSLVEWH